MMVAMVAALGFTGCQVRYRSEVEAPGTAAQHRYAAGEFVRYDGYSDVAGDMEIASVDYSAPNSDLTIRLVGVIHIGDAAYYRQLQKVELDTADTVLFEGVKMEGVEPKAGGGKALGDMYSAMGKLLGISFQKDHIDYKSENFVHCDVTVGPGDPLNNTVDMSQLEAVGQVLNPLVTVKSLISATPEGKRLEDALKHSMAEVMLMQLDAFTGDEADRALEERLAKGKKGPALPGMNDRIRKAAEQIRKMGGFGGFGLPKEMKEQILDRRNDYVLARLKERVDAAEKGREQTVAVFYGAAHMPGIAAEMAKWGYEPQEQRWFKAWSMNSKYAASGGAQARPTAKAQPKRQHQPPQRRAPQREREPVLY